MATDAGVRPVFRGAHAQARTLVRNTVIEDAPQVSLRPAPPAKSSMPERPTVVTPMSDDFPTPRAIPPQTSAESGLLSPAGTDTQSNDNSLWSKGNHENEFDDMYDLTDSESEGEVPIKLSTSVKKQLSSARSTRQPSLIIPSPSEWPTIEKFKSSVTPLSPPLKLDMPPAVLARIQRNKLRVPSTYSTPSLDESTSGEEDMSSLSCPSTPEVDPEEAPERPWEMPIQLDPSTISLLEQINGEEERNHAETVIELPAERTMEMKEVAESPPITAPMRLETKNLEPLENRTPFDGEDELSALSIPSPGGFFASLDSFVARKAWMGSETAPNTSIATQFYGVPFRSDLDAPPVPPLKTNTAELSFDVSGQGKLGSPAEQSVPLPSPERAGEPITAKRIESSPTDLVKEVDEIDETYKDALKQTATANLNRTRLWLSAQTDYMTAVCADDPDITDTFQGVADAVPTTPETTTPPSEDSSPGKKCVRFADPPVEHKKQEDDGQKKRVSPIHDGTFWEGWRFQKQSQRARDVFQHRQARAEAEHVQRSSCQKQHLEQLQGRYEIKPTSRPAPSRPISNFLPQNEQAGSTELIERVERERQALELMSPSSWHASAQKEINGGRLITSPIAETFKGRNDVEVLDLEGQVHCSWAWNVAIDHPDAEIHTTVSTDVEAHIAESTLDGPLNHHVVAALKPWELPFPHDTFDVISARHLYCQLKTVWPKGYGADEWDLTLRECLRCLKPGGYLEFNLLDAELVHADTACQALGVEFAFDLKTRGYDPCSGKNFLPRLRRAGFESIKRAWLILPVADVQQRWTDAGKSGSGDIVPTPASSSGNGMTERTIDSDGQITFSEAPSIGSTKDVRAMTGLVGARMWEQWMLKLNTEMGRSEERCLDGIAKALEESGRGQAGWRSLVGWARKGV